MRLLVLLLCVNAGLAGRFQVHRHKTILQKIQHEPEYSTFYNLIRNNGAVNRDLLYQPLTVFVPQNEAFDQYEDELYSDLATYHMSFEVKTLKLLDAATSLPSVNLANPPLWITKVDNDTYVNNAKILKDKSYVSRSRNDDMGQPQVLHMIDRVLNPMIRSPEFPPTAYDLLTSTLTWDLGTFDKVTKFHQKVHENNLLKLFRKEEPHTFFIPVDSGIDHYRYRTMDKKIILRHIVPTHVLFTRPSEGYVVPMQESIFSYNLYIERIDDSMFVKGALKEGTPSDTEELQFSSEILVPNIPVKNGVVHLISQPLGNFKSALKPFPYLPILEKISNDPELDIIYKMGRDTHFNSKLKRDDVNYTYFVSKDSAWTKIANLGLEPSESFGDILARHLVISEAPYSMQELATMTMLNNYTDITLKSELGDLRMSVLKMEETYFVRWNNKFIKVLRADYECTNGFVHVLNGPLANFRRIDNSTANTKRLALVNYLNMLQNMIL